MIRLLIDYVAYFSIFFNREQVLSRLCGGELPINLSQVPAIFLSRLCGGECTGTAYAPMTAFLSRLCGGE